MNKRTFLSESSDVKMSPEREARRRNLLMSPMAAERGTAIEVDEEQRRLQTAASKWLGTLSSGNTQPSETASERVRDSLRRRYGR